MIYGEVASGGVTLNGCVVFIRKRHFAGDFLAGEIVYDANKARRGVLEKVVIKEARVVKARGTFGSNRVLYVDTFNGLWNEHDLVPYEVAVELMQDVLDALEKVLNRLPPC